MWLPYFHIFRDSEEIQSHESMKLCLKDYLISEKKTHVLTRPLCAARASSSLKDVCSDLDGSFDPPKLGLCSLHLSGTVNEIIICRSGSPGCIQLYVCPLALLFCWHRPPKPASLCGFYFVEWRMCRQRSEDKSLSNSYLKTILFVTHHGPIYEWNGKMWIVLLGWPWSNQDTFVSVLLTGSQKAKQLVVLYIYEGWRDVWPLKAMAYN